MPSSLASEVLQHLQTALRCRHAAGLSDGQLLGRFIEQGDESAFAAIVRSHGPMVWGVCRRVTGDHHDAEDAFQAAFLVLARKASSIAPREMLANWLHGVARQTALKIRATAARRKGREKQVAQMPELACAEQQLERELQPLLDEELSHLPDNYRAVVILCDLQGKTRKEAARQLGWPEGTVAGRQARAREMLARRLARRGLGVAGAALAAILSQNSAAGMPAALASSTVEAATLVAAGKAVPAGVVSGLVAALADKVVTGMLLSKLKADVLIVLLGCALVLGGSVAAHRALADKPAANPPKKVRADQSRKEVQGVVQTVDATGNTITLTENKLVGERTFKIAGDARVLIADGTARKTGMREGRLAEVTPGAVVALSLSADDQARLVHVEGPSITAVLKSVNGGASTVTVTLASSKTKEMEDRTFQVAADANIVISTDKKDKSSSSKLTDLPAGSLVMLKLSGDQKSVGQITAQGQTIRGTVKAVDARSIRVSVSEGKNVEEKTFTVGKDATVLMDEGKGKKASREGKLSDLAAGTTVSLRLSLDQKEVVAVQVEPLKLQGTLEAVDVEKKTLTITISRKGEPTEKKNIPIARDARLQVDGQDAKLADLPTNAQVLLVLTGNQREAVHVQVEGVGVRGTVKGNAGNNSITIGGKGDDQTYSIAAGARILIEGKVGKLTDLVDGAVVSAKTSADKKQLIGTIQGEGPTTRGVVKAVDTESITLTVGGKNGVGGEDRTFKVTKRTRVVTAKFGVARQLTDVKVEAEVSVQLTIDQKEAARLIVLGE